MKAATLIVEAHDVAWLGPGGADVAAVDPHVAGGETVDAALTDDYLAFRHGFPFRSGQPFGSLEWRRVAPMLEDTLGRGVRCQTPGFSPGSFRNHPVGLLITHFWDRFQSGHGEGE